MAEKGPGEGLEELESPGAKDRIYVHKRAVVSNSDIAEARVAKNEVGQPVVEVTFTKESWDKVGRFSGDNIGKVAAVFVDGKLVSAPTIRAKFSEKAQITGVTKEEAERISKGIKAE